MKNNRLCDLLGIRYPIIQAGMVWVSTWQLAAAASNAGVLGTVGVGAMRPDAVKENIEKMFQNTDKPFAVNIPMLRADAADTANLVLDMGVKIIITSAGNPAKIVPLVKRPGVTVMHVVPSVRGAVKCQKEGVDAVICEGFEAGGHNSPDETTTMALVPQVADAVDIPVVAAGGIADGRGMAAAFALGAHGVQLGTRFIATQECNASQAYKQLIVDTPDTGTTILGRKYLMLRVIKNAFAETMAQAEKQGASVEELEKLLRDEGSRNKAASLDGDLENGTFQAGQSSGLVHDIPTVAELVQRLIREYEMAMQSLPVIMD
jgi:enoyl-[acyl-carrier protein] reductase II